MPLHLTLTRNDLKKWARSFTIPGKDRTSPNDWIRAAAEDYAACRFLIFGGLLLNGSVLGAQALEKILKCHLLVERNGKFPKNTHSLKSLSTELATYRPTGTELDLFSVLDDAYFGFRYPDNIAKLLSRTNTFGMSSTIIHEIDIAFLNLIDGMPIPPEAKFSSSFFAYLFARRGSAYSEALIKDNKALTNRIRNYEVAYQTVRSHLQSHEQSKQRQIDDKRSI